MTFTISRYTVTDPERADAPRSRRELNALRALGAILNKPQWWLKRSRADVKAKWAMEIDEALVRANVAQVVRVWPSPYAILRTLQPLVELARSTAENKESEIQRHLEHVTYPHGYQDKYDGFGMGNSYESDDDLGEAAENWSEICKQYDATAVETDFETVRRHHESLNAFGEIGWYVTMDIVRERLQSLSLAEWTGENVENLIEGELMKVEAVTRTTDLLLAIRCDEHPLSLHTVKRHLPRESRENVLKLVLFHVQRIVEYLSTARKDIDTILELIAKQERLCDETAKRTQHSTPGPVPKTRLSDDAVPPETKRKFVENVAALENVPDDQKDWHPNSGNQVLDLIHPSLFCGVIGKTKALPVSARDDIQGNVVDHFKSIMFRPTPDGLGGPRGIKYQWLPSEFDVSSDGQSVAIRSYINNLHPEIHSSLYQSIASIFSRFVPLFDHVICSLGSNDTEPDTNLLGEGPTSGLRRLARSTHLGMDPTKFSLKGKRCQVIVKIAEIHLTPEKPDYGGGAWHIEGTDAERIIATGLYYFGCENITESRLSFRTFVCAPDYEQSDDIGIALSYDLHNEQLLIQHLGSLTAMEDRCVVFPNIYQHKVEPFSLADPTKPGVRKILAFFLVDPVNDPIPSTAIIPPQQQEWIDRAHEPEMKRLRLPEVVKSQIQDMTRDGMSLEEAKKVRLKLMDERSPVQDEDYDDEMMFSLCEH